MFDLHFTNTELHNACYIFAIQSTGCLSWSLSVLGNNFLNKATGSKLHSLLVSTLYAVFHLACSLLFTSRIISTDLTVLILNDLMNQDFLCHFHVFLATHVYTWFFEICVLICFTVFDLLCCFSAVLPVPDD